MMRALYAGVAGLKTHQTRMDVIGNNIANVNTTAYKSQSMTFSDLMYQTTQAASGANTTTGNGFEMDAIAMAVFGGISSTGGKGNLAGGIISAFIIVCLRVGLGQKNVNAQVILLIIGVLLVAAVALPNIIGDVKKAVAMKKN